VSSAPERAAGEDTTPGSPYTRSVAAPSRTDTDEPDLERPGPAGDPAARDRRAQKGLTPERLLDLVGRVVEIALLMLLDAVAIGAAIYSGFALREVVMGRTVYWETLWAVERQWLPFVLLVAILVLLRNGLYRPRERRPGGAAIASALFLATVLIGIFAVVTDNDRFTTYLIFPYSFVVASLLVALNRGVFDAILGLLARALGLHRRLLVVGLPEATRDVEAALREAAPGAGIRSVTHLDDIEHLGAAITEHHPDDVILARPPDDETMLLALETCRAHGVRLRVVPTAAGLLAHHADYVPGLAVPLFDIVPPTIKGIDWVAKRTFDIVVSLLLLLLLSPVLLLSMLAIKVTSPGPILFRDRRVGLGQEPFSMLKLRSMVTNADQEQAELEARNEADGALFKIRDDPRVTPVGRVLRRLSIDELPQLINVVKGEMSLVGPRPLPMRDYVLLEPWHRRRYSVLPGITGLWQVSGRSDLGFDALVRLDFYYLESWSIWMDIAIIARTPYAILRGRGAY
jgi:exopolysaccharide biosynthesis polyprenyl glycosylphosphotransferase